MNKKLLTIITIVLLMSTAIVVTTPGAEARTIHQELDKDICNQGYMYYDTVDMKNPFKINVSTYTGGFLLFKGTPAKEAEVRNALENGNIYDVPDMIVKVDDRLEAGTYVVVCNNPWINYQEYVNGKWIDSGHTPINKEVKVTTQFLSVQMSAGKGDSVKVTIDADSSIGLGAYVITKALMNSIGSYYNPILTIKNNMNHVLAYDENIDDKCTLEFKSDGVNDYYLVILIEDNNSRMIHHFTGDVEASGLSETVNPMPFAIVVFIISIALLAGVIYLGRKKIIE